MQAWSESSGWCQLRTEAAARRSTSSGRPSSKASARRMTVRRRSRDARGRRGEDAASQEARSEKSRGRNGSRGRTMCSKRGLKSPSDASQGKYGGGNEAHKGDELERDRTRDACVEDGAAGGGACAAMVLKKKSQSERSRTEALEKKREENRPGKAQNGRL
ncbi:hypothetical protein TGCAST_366450 [Toxoplasma gondii CAST]|uniref:Uncharacterized protein n=1 Tax=Toxoplasma gondii CAST TaxID=943122 RepID=A0A3R8AXZ1_TOXGO|nr:hypothetical protein TGCAST_366450 [Toxoplasma gondii CAST]